MKKDLLMQILRPTISLVIICLVVSAALAGTNALTKDIIARQATQNEKDAMSRVVPAEEYTPITLDVTYLDCSGYAAVSSGEAVGYVFTTTAKGYGGEISVMTGIDTQGKITAIEVLDVADETPGLGQNATTESFASQFTGLFGQISVVKNNPGENQISALTGATITSQAVADAVNRALEAYGSNINQKGAAN